MCDSVLTLSLGSNLGNRRENIENALKFLESELGSPFMDISEIIETEAIGFIGPKFLNVLVQYRTSLDPRTVLTICKKVETLMGRKEVMEYDNSGNRIFHDRIIDIDILKYGDYVVDTKELTIPHPQIGSRPFIKELAAGLANW